MQLEMMKRGGFPNPYSIPAAMQQAYDYSNKSVLQNDFLTAKQMTTDRTTAGLFPGQQQQVKDPSKMTSEQQQQQQLLATMAAQGGCRDCRYITVIYN